nr:MAG TPA: hypothetical protein [Caudoviricetes sp.]
MFLKISKILIFSPFLKQVKDSNPDKRLSPCSASLKAIN